MIQPELIAVNLLIQYVHCINIQLQLLRMNIRLDNIAFLHYLAMEQGTSAALQELNMARTNQKDTLTYVAELLVHTSGTDEKQIQITGQIQLDSNGKIHAVHVNGQELLRILETQN